MPGGLLATREEEKMRAKLQKTSSYLLSFSRRDGRLSRAAYAFPAAAVAAFGRQLKFPRSRVGRLREAEL